MVNVKDFFRLFFLRVTKNSQWIFSMSDQALLVKIARTRKCYGDRIVAVRKITDENILTEIVFTDKNPYVRIVIVKNITDEDVLAIVAKTDPEWQVRIAATQKITDQEILVDIAKTDKNISNRMTAIERITNQTALIEIVKTEKTYDGRATAVRRITNQTALIKMVKDVAFLDVHAVVTEHITNQKVLIQIAENRYNNASVRLAAVEHITNQETLMNVAKTDTDLLVCTVAIEKITDPDTLIWIMENNKNEDVRKVAKKSLYILQGRSTLEISDKYPASIKHLKEFSKQTSDQKLNPESVVKFVDLIDLYSNLYKACFFKYTRIEGLGYSLDEKIPMQIGVCATYYDNDHDIKKFTYQYLKLANPNFVLRDCVKCELKIEFKKRCVLWQNNADKNK